VGAWRPYTTSIGWGGRPRQPCACTKIEVMKKLTNSANLKNAVSVKNYGLLYRRRKLVKLEEFSFFFVVVLVVEKVIGQSKAIFGAFNAQFIWSHWDMRI
jgi:hypothetical protein